MKVGEILDGCSEWSCAEGYEALRPMVSVLLPTFRRAKSGLFETAVQSVLDQDFQNWELIIIDDGSTDGTADLIAHFMRNDRRISCIRHRYNIGLPAISEYEGYEKVRGEYIAFIFDDNKWERDYLSKTMNYMVRKNAKAAYGRVRSYYGSEAEAFVELGASTNGLGIHMLPVTNFIANGGVILAKEVVETVGFYDPHIALTRLCDWHYWKRIVRKYEFHETGILAGIETGVMQKDSLGNSYQMSSWMAAEREAMVCDWELIPVNFRNIEINCVNKNSTQLFSEWVCLTYSNFWEKKWYQLEETVTVERSRNFPLRILVLAASYDASMDLSFLHLNNTFPMFIFKFGSAQTPLNEVAQADAVVLVRSMIFLENYRKICEKLEIPCYLYIDDNFIELAKENKKDAALQLYRAALEKDYGYKYKGIIVSTVALKNYLIERGINRNVFCLEPYGGEICPSDTAQIADIEGITLAYMGGPHRDLIFVNDVMPAVARLSQDMRIQILTPSRINLSNYSEIKNLDIVQIPYTLSLDFALMQYSKFNPKILLHCGPKILNNQYKTRNALLNATRMGAVLVASDVLPYRNDEQTGISWLCAENTVQQWYEILDNLIRDKDKQRDVFDHALHYCQMKYSKENAVQVLQQIFCDIHPAGYAEITQRLNDAMLDTLYVKTMEQNPVTAGGSSKPSRSLTEVPLSFTGGIPERKSYQIRCKTETFSELGLCFSAYGEAKGRARIKISCKEGQLREFVLDLEEYVHDNWTYFSFDPILNARNQIYKIVLEFEYDADSAFVGVFEDATKRSFLYRLTNKLGHPIPVTDLLFADCR